MSKQVYVIDLENIGTVATVSILNGLLLDKSNCAIVCYSETTCYPTRILQDVKQHVTKRIMFQRCSTGKADEMDIQLAALVGNLCARYPKRQFIVVSDDMGYSSAVEFLQQQGYFVFRNKASELVYKSRLLSLPRMDSGSVKVIYSDIPTKLQRKLKSVCRNNSRLRGEYDNVIDIIRDSNYIKSVIQTKLSCEYVRDHKSLYDVIEANLR